MLQRRPAASSQAAWQHGAPQASCAASCRQLTPQRTCWARRAAARHAAWRARWRRRRAAAHTASLRWRAGMPPQRACRAGAPRCPAPGWQARGAGFGVLSACRKGAGMAVMVWRKLAICTAARCVPTVSSCRSTAGVNGVGGDPRSGSGPTHPNAPQAEVGTTLRRPLPPAKQRAQRRQHGRLPHLQVPHTHECEGIGAEPAARCAADVRLGCPGLDLQGGGRGTGGPACVHVCVCVCGRVWWW